MVHEHKRTLDLVDCDKLETCKGRLRAVFVFYDSRSIIVAEGAMVHVVEGDYQIRPRDISLEGAVPLMMTFGYGEVERVAANYIKRCQEAGNAWLVLTEEEYQRICGELLQSYHFFDEDEDQPYEPTREAAGKFLLLDPGFMVRGDDGKYRVTDDFIRRCARRA